MHTELRALFLTDTAAEAEAWLAELRRGGYRPDHELAADPRAARAALARGPWDVAVAALDPAAWTGESPLALCKAAGSAVPIVVVGDEVPVPLAVALMREGADDVVSASGLERLAPAVERVLRERALAAERAAADRERARTEARFRDLVDMLPVVVFEADLEGRLTFANRRAFDAFGYAEGDFSRGLTIFRMIVPEDAEAVRGIVRGLFAGAPPALHAYTALRKDGSTFPIEIVSTLLFEDGAPRGVRGVIVDVSERVQALEALARNEALLRAMLDAIPYPVFAKGTDMRYTACNDAFAAFLGHPMDTIVGKSVRDIAPTELADRYEAADAELLSRAGHQHYEGLVRRADGEVRDVIFDKETIRDRSGRATGLVGIYFDVTDRKRAEEHLRTSLAEKEVLLKEIHHRVKNNLQVISSLLSLQAGRAPDPRLADYLAESRNRIKSMALIHESLYKSGDLARVGFAGYLGELVAGLARNYGVRARAAVEGENLSLPVDIAIPCGLVVNELVSNAFKYAFPDGQAGNVRVVLSRPAPGRAAIVVADDGVGIPPELDPLAAGTLGLQIVSQLAVQIDGTLTFTRAGGTSFTLEFPLA